MDKKTEDWIHRFYEGLQTFEEATFPKTCRVCGRTYRDSSDFIEQTQSVNRKTGLTEFHDDDGQPIVSLYRNCVCGSTLLADYKDRRDLSEAGRKRREQFEVILQMLIEKGITRETARLELLKLLRGERSDILQAFGIRPFAEA